MDFTLYVAPSGLPQDEYRGTAHLPPSDCVSGCVYGHVYMLCILWPVYGGVALNILSQDYRYVDYAHRISIYLTFPVPPPPLGHLARREN
jgi:hypothetical protein